MSVSAVFVVTCFFIFYLCHLCLISQQESCEQLMPPGDWKVRADVCGFFSHHFALFLPSIVPCHLLVLTLVNSEA